MNDADSLCTNPVVTYDECLNAFPIIQNEIPNAVSQIHLPTNTNTSTSNSTTTTTTPSSNINGGSNSNNNIATTESSGGFGKRSVSNCAGITTESSGGGAFGKRSVTNCNDTYHPSGCFLNTITNEAYFNPNEGGPNSEDRQLCKWNSEC